MLESSARRGWAQVAVTLLILCLATACAGEKEGAPPPATPTPMAGLNTSAMRLPRIDFCSLVPDSAVKAALGAKPDHHATYGNGDQQDLPGAGRQVVHEVGCSWTTDAGDAARAWVFAQPVDDTLAKAVVTASRREVGCRLEQGPEFGDPSLLQVCRVPGGKQRVRHAGLFGQTWLSCEVAATGSDVPARSEQWCVQVANALNTAR